MQCIVLLRKAGTETQAVNIGHYIQMENMCACTYYMTYIQKRSHQLDHFKKIFFFCKTYKTKPVLNFMSRVTTGGVVEMILRLFSR